LAQLVERGLSGVRLVVADAHAGIAVAVRRHLPEAPCVVHFQRNVLGKAAPVLSRVRVSGFVVASHSLLAE
jgi:transposase-like protein